MAKEKTFSPPVTLPAQTTAKKLYERPSFTVVPLNIESPLLSGSGTPPTAKKLPIVDDITNGKDW